MEPDNSERIRNCAAREKKEEKEEVISMEIKNGYRIYGADDEEPSCRNCDHILDSDKYCIDNCGGANAWNGYERTERME